MDSDDVLIEMALSDVHYYGLTQVLRVMDDTHTRLLYDHNPKRRHAIDPETGECDTCRAALHGCIARALPPRGTP
jgi:hypothetical protein